MAALQEVEIAVAQADVLPFDGAATQEGGPAGGAAVVRPPFAFEALEIGIADEVLDVDDASRHAIVLPEGVAIPIGHMPVAEHGAARGRDGRESVEIVIGMPAAEVDDFDGIEGDALAVNLVEVAGDDALLVGRDGHAVGAQQPDFARLPASVAGEEPVGVAMQLKRADRLLEEFKAAGQRIGLAEQRFQRVVFDADAFFAFEAINFQRHEGAGFGDAVDGDVDPGRASVNAGALDIRRRIEREAVVRRHAFDMGGARAQAIAAIAEKVGEPVEHGSLLCLVCAQASRARGAKGDYRFTRTQNS